jgi:hypothetical protein
MPLTTTVEMALDQPTPMSASGYWRFEVTESPLYLFFDARDAFGGPSSDILLPAGAELVSNQHHEISPPLFRALGRIRLAQRLLDHAAARHDRHRS